MSIISLSQIRNVLQISLAERQPDFLMSPETRSFFGKPFGNAERFSMPFQAFGTETGTKKLPAASENPVSLIPTVGKFFSTGKNDRIILLYKVPEIYGAETEIPYFGRIEIPISMGQHVILLISAVETVPVHWPMSVSKF